MAFGHMNEKYQEAWAAYYRSNRRSWWLIAAVILSFVIGVSAFGTPVPGYVLFVGMVTWWIVENERVRHFPCPRCGDPFFRGLFFHISTAKHCVHCGLPFGAIDNVR
jgi:predicted RNA-binding Zn-ribbon protein involved in translation (DUF1610 family)